MFHGKIDEAQDIRVTAYTKLMQDFKSQAETMEVRSLAGWNKNGKRVVLACGDGDKLFSLATDSNSKTGFSQQSLSSQGSHPMLCCGTDGLLKGFAIKDFQLQCFHEKEDAPGKFSENIPVSIPLPFNADCVATAHSRQLADGFCIAALLHVSDSGAYYLANLVWKNGSAPELFEVVPRAFHGTTGILSGSTLKDLTYLHRAVTSQGDFLTVYSLYDYSQKRYERTDEEETAILQWHSVQTSKGAVTLALLKNGDHKSLSRVVFDDAKRTYSFESVYTAAKISSFETACFVDSSGTERIHIAAVSDSKSLLHGTMRLTTGGTWFTETLVELNDTKIAGLSLSCGDGISLFHAHENGVAESLQIDPDSTSWEQVKIQVPSEAQISEIACFSTELTLCDKDEIPLSCTDLVVWTAEPSILETPAGIYSVDQTTTIKLKTDAIGRVTLIQHCENTSPPEIFVKLAGGLNDEEAILIRQNESLRTRLASADADQLYNAKKSDGTYLLPSEYRTCENAGNLASAIAQMMEVGLAPELRQAPSSRSAVGAYIMKGMRKSHACGFTHAANDGNGFVLRFKGFSIGYKTLEAAEIETHLAMLESGCENGGICELFCSVGDFFKRAISAAESGVEILVKRVASGFEMAASYIVEGITFVFKGVIRFFNQIFEAIQSFFARVGVFFKDLFHWLGEILDWKNVIRHKCAISHVTLAGLRYLRNNAEAINQANTKEFEKIRTQIHALFEQLKREVGGSSSMNSHVKKIAPPQTEYEQKQSNNFFLRSIQENGSGMEIRATQGELAAFAALKEGSNPLEDYINTIQGDPAFDTASSFMKKQDGAGGLYVNPLVTILEAFEALSMLAVNTGDTLCHAVFEGLVAAIDALEALLTTKIEIPLLSRLYKSVISGGNDLTLLDLFSLVVAAPAALISGIIGKGSLLPDTAALGQFKKDIDLAYSGKKETSRMLPSRKTRILLKVFGGLAGTAFYLSSFILDMKGLVPPLPVPPPPPSCPSCMAFGALILETIWQATGVPELFSDHPTEDDIAIWMFTWTGIGLDIVYMVKGHQYIDENDTIGTSATTIYGVAHIIIGFFKCKKLSLGYALVSSFVEMSKISSLKWIKEATNRKSVYFTCSLDVIGSLGILGLTIEDATTTE